MRNETVHACKKNNGEGEAKPFHPYAQKRRFKSHKVQTLLLGHACSLEPELRAQLHTSCSKRAFLANHQTNMSLETSCAVMVMSAHCAQT